MASKQRRTPSSTASCRREIMRPIISTDVMGNRNVEIVPVGAWVEPANVENQVDAILAAQIEEEKIRRMKEEKENQLRSFQREVRKRVSHAREVKRQQQIQEAEKAFALERKVILQSFQTGDMSRKDTCSLRHDFDHAIKARLLEKYGEDVSEWGSEKLQDFGNEVDKSHQVTDKARQELSSKQISHTPLIKTIPGEKIDNNGKATKEIQNPSVRTLVDLDFETLQKTDDENVNEEGFDDAEDEVDEDNEDNESEEEPDNEDSDAMFKGNKPTVQFAETPPRRIGKRKKKTSATNKRPSSAKLASLLSQFKENEILDRQRKQQAAVSRRIFMDREREAVRENIRRQQHRKKIIELKREKEAYRHELETLSQKQHEPIDPITGETASDRKIREQIEEMHLQEMVNRRKDELRRNREMERYLDALRHSLMEKAQRQGTQLPPLCACGENIWDTHPETCANNCFFYKNHRAYARALQSLLSSVEVM